MVTNIKVIKKDGTLQDFKMDKVVTAANKSAYRAMRKLNAEEISYLEELVEAELENKNIWEREEKGLGFVTVPTMHNIVEKTLGSISPDIAKSYRDYRDYKTSFVAILDSVYKKSQSIMYIGDKENSNSDSTLASTKRCLIYGQLNKELYQKFFMTTKMLQACKDGYLYVHDMSSRRDGFNCFRRNTMFLTENGPDCFMWHEDGEVIEGVFDKNGIPRKATVHSYGKQQLVDVFLERGYSNKSVKVTCTRNHRWILQDESETTELKPGDVLYSYHNQESWRVAGIVSPDDVLSMETVWCLEVEDDHSFLIYTKDGLIPTGNCCLFDVEEVLNGGFEMGNIWYNEPKTLDVAFDVIGDIILSAASQQYGGFTTSRIDEILSKYAKLSFEKYKNEYIKNGLRTIENVMGYTSDDEVYHVFKSKIEEDAKKDAWKKVKIDYRQGFQGLEYKLNTVASSRGDYPFTTLTISGMGDEFSKLAAEMCLEVRKQGQGAPGHKKAVLFPKIVFTYTEDLHGDGKPLADLFDKAIDCSLKAAYPDYLSLDGDTTVAEMYHKYGEIIAPMGCRAFLSPYYERGEMEPADENDKPFFIGRFNIGVVSLHLPMIYSKAKQEDRDFYEVLDEYLQLAREIHIKTYEYLGEMKASTNPMAFCQGGMHGGHLQPHDKIKPLLKYTTASFGITALNELNRLYNGKSIREDGQFPLEVMQHINDKLAEYKKEDHILYAVYGTPAESLAGTQVTQFRKMYGIVENVSDREYVTNSFHCHVSEEMTGIEKQDKEFRFWNLLQGGRIQYVKYDINYNKEAVKAYVKRAMSMGLYEGVNFTLCFCEDCGHSGVSLNSCPKCGSKNMTKIERINHLSHNKAIYYEKPL